MRSPFIDDSMAKHGEAEDIGLAMTSKTCIRVGRPFLFTMMLLRSPCRTRVRRLTLPFEGMPPAYTVADVRCVRVLC